MYLKITIKDWFVNDAVIQNKRVMCLKFGCYSQSCSNLSTYCDFVPFNLFYQRQFYIFQRVVDLK